MTYAEIAWRLVGLAALGMVVVMIILGTPPTRGGSR